MAKRIVLEVAGVVMDVGESILDSKLNKEYVGITQATKLLGIAHAQYVRRLVVGAKLGSIKVQLEHYSKWFVSKVSIASYLKNSRRTSTDRRFILRTELKNEAGIRKALKDAGIEFSLELNYKGSVKS